MARSSDGGPTVRGVGCVLVYTASFVAATLVGFAPLPGRVEGPLQRVVLRPAAWTGGRVDWAAHRWVDRARLQLGTSPYFRAFTRAVLDDAVRGADGAAGYVGTVDPPAADAVGWVERELADAGFRRNPTAYLEYRERDGRQFERASWARRSSVDADRQLHVRLYEAGGGRVDVYGHREPSVAAGADHYGTPDYRDGAATIRAEFDRREISVDRRPGIQRGRPDSLAGD